jgi:hypothetical protein
MKALFEINSLLRKYSYITHYEIEYIEDDDLLGIWIVSLDISDSNKLYGDSINIKLIDVKDLKMKSPNANLGGEFSLLDIRDRQLERTHYYFEDCEERIIVCYSRSVIINDHGNITTLV